MYEFKFPDVGEGITEGKLVEWKINPGDNIKIDQPIASVETDKAVVDIPTPISGKVSELLFSNGDTLNVGDVIMKVEDFNNESNSKEEIVEKPKEEEIIENQENTFSNKTLNNNNNEILAMPKVRNLAKKQNIDLSLINPSGTHGEILEKDLSNINKKTSDISESNLKIGTLPLEEKIDDDREIIATTSVVKFAEKNNIPIENVIGTGDGGRILFKDVKNYLTKPNEVINEIVKEKIPEHILKDVEEIEIKNTKREIIASPSTRQLARDLDVDLNTVLGTGEGGKILSEDVKRAAKPEKLNDNKEDIDVQIEKENIIEKEVNVESKKLENKDDNPQINIESHHLENVTEGIKLPIDMRVPLEGVRKIISDKMMESLNKTAQVTICDEVDVSKLVNLRNREKEKLKNQGIKLTYLPFFMKAFVETAREFPYFNAIFDEKTNEIVLRNQFNIGIATDTERGLLVPVIDNCDNKSIIHLSKEIVESTNLAREGKLKPENLQNGTFTITSIGNLGGQFFTPILNYPQVAILGIGKIISKPIVINNEIVIRDVVTLSLTFDHRIVDGADAAKFLKKYCQLINDIEMLLMGA